MCPECPSQLGTLDQQQTIRGSEILNHEHCDSAVSFVSPVSSAQSERPMQCSVLLGTPCSHWPRMAPLGSWVSAVKSASSDLIPSLFGIFGLLRSAPLSSKTQSRLRSLL